MFRDNISAPLCKDGEHGPHSSTLVVICVVRLLSVLYGCYLCCYICCLCVNMCCHWVTTQLQLIYIYISSRARKSKKNANHTSVSGLYSEICFNKNTHFNTKALLPSTVVYCCQFLLRFVTSNFAIIDLHDDSVESIKLWIATGRIIVCYCKNTNVIECSLIPLEQNRSWLQRRQAQRNALWSTS
jgi:hypothetical protein